MIRVWAPGASRVDLVAEDRIPLEPQSGGWWAVDATVTDYGFSLDGGLTRPDPRASWLPHGVHGLSRSYDHEAFAWTDQLWNGAPLAGQVLYELHIGTFTQQGTFEAAVDRLDHLVDLGVTSVQLLPCNAFDGRWGWGYDGVAWYAVHEPYGGPDGLKRFVDACHAKGLGVVMDVVYNHLGPSGNYLPEFGPYLTAEHTTPWGPAVNLDRVGSDEVRRFVLDSALAWLEDFHVDGLRLDAVHALVDERATHVLEELSVEVEALGARLGRSLWLVAESDLNDPRLLRSREAGGDGLDGQWCDDVHHSLHAALTGERAGYYSDFGSLAGVAKVLTGAFFHDGTWSSFRGRSHGRPVPDTVPGHRFVVYLQDHDQIGNRAVGDRIAETLSTGLLKAGAALVLTSPFTPMLFMGEEWAARTPWLFFSDHAGDLGEAIRKGRRAEFASHGWVTDEVPDPQDRSTVDSSVLDWETQDASVLAWYRDLIALRRARPELSDGRRDLVEVTYDEVARWIVVRRGMVALACNLAAHPQQVPVSGTVLLASADPDGSVLAGESAVVYELA